MENQIILNHNLESYQVIKHKSGIYSLIFNTKDRWINFHQYNNTEYTFGESDINDIQKIPEFLPTDISFVPTVIQEKDQIIFYFIPIKGMLMPKDSEIILSSK